MGPTLAEQFGLRLPEPPTDWLPGLPDEYRKRWVRLETMGAARRRTEPAFVKPPNDKSFLAKVYRGDELPADFPDDAPVLAAEVVAWDAEFRCFVLDRTVRTFSVYLRDGELQRESDFRHDAEEERDMTAFVSTLLADGRIALPRAAVVDVGVIRGRGWAVVEQNAAWASGLYGCDPEAALDVLRHAAEPAGRGG